MLDDLRQLKSSLAKRSEYTDCQVTYSRVPLVSLRDKESQIEVQIVLSNETAFARGRMEHYMREFTCLRELFMVVKVMFDIRHLTDVYMGGFGTYSIFYMIVASLLHSKKRNPKLYKDPDTATALMDFLKFWGTLNTEKVGVSIDPYDLFDKDHHKVMSDKTRSQLMVR